LLQYGEERREMVRIEGYHKERESNKRDVKQGFIISLLALLSLYLFGYVTESTVALREQTVLTPFPKLERERERERERLGFTAIYRKDQLETFFGFSD
jgi:hypothetical protein